MAKIEAIRHSLSHIMAYAVLSLYPKVKLGIGPIIEDGFYYDFEFTKSFSEKDLIKVEKRMRQIIKENITFKKVSLSKPQITKLFKNQPYKLELMKDFKKAKEKITFVKSGEFTDLCEGNHVKKSKEINPDAFKLIRVAGAYWKGNEKNPMLTRIYGLGFETKKELKEHLKIEQEAQKRDHRKLGKELDLFVFSEEVGPGLPLLTEKGNTIRRELERFVVDEEIKRNYLHVYTPDLARVKLYEISGHYPYYKDDMYPVMKVDEDRLVLRPMTCPHHFILYKDKPRSYKELPMRIAEVAKMYRYEKSGELTGLLRVRGFCLADAHIFCRKSQAADIIKEVIGLIDFMSKKLGLKKGKDYWFRLSLGDRKNKTKYYDDPKNWNLGEKILKKVLEDVRAPYVVARDEAAFYGPKIDVQMRNVRGKEETAFTVQYDFCLPSRFKLRYINEKGKEEQPVVVHRSSIGALERTMAFLIEHYAGKFPLWLAPEQVWIIPIGKKHVKYANEIAKLLSEIQFRYKIKDDNETLSKKIRNGELQKIPYLIVLGDKEIKSKSVAVRYKGKDIGQVKLDNFIKRISKEVKDKK